MIEWLGVEAHEADALVLHEHVASDSLTQFLSQHARSQSMDIRNSHIGTVVEKERTTICTVSSSSVVQGRGAELVPSVDISFVTQEQKHDLSVTARVKEG